MNIIGKKIDRYEVLEQIGKGGMAEVYKVKDTRLNRIVALKMIRTDAIPKEQHERFLARFEREAQALANLDHPNIIPVHDYGDYNGNPYIVMKYQSGGTLKDKMGTPMDFQEAANLLIPIANALAYAHEHGIIHRDVKPSNILLNGRPMLADFGIAKMLESDDRTLTGTGMGVGTPSYMALEQWQGKPVPKSDVYSLGVIFYELVTGKKPYHAETATEILVELIKENFDNPKNVNQSIPNKVENIILNALKNNTNERSSIQDFHSSLEKIVNNTFIQEKESKDYDETFDQIDISIVDQSKDKIVNKKKKFNHLTWIIPSILLLLVGTFFMMDNELLERFGISQKEEIVIATETEIDPIHTPIIKNTATLQPTKTSIPIAESDQEPSTLQIWSFTNEVLSMAIAYEKYNPYVDVEYTMIPMTDGEYQDSIRIALDTSDVPDVIAMEAAFVKEYVGDDFLANLNDLSDEIEAVELYEGMVEIGTDDGNIKALSYQFPAGAFFYRRSLAEKYLGVSEPDDVQKLISNFNGFVSTAEKIKINSNGSAYMVANVEEFLNPFKSNREQPWVVDNHLVIDPMIVDYVETAKLFRDNGYDAEVGTWSEGWFASFRDDLVDDYGKPKEIFGYFLPTWGLLYVVHPNARDINTGDWAIIPGPMPYHWGGTWLGVMKDSDNLSVAKDFISFMISEENLTNWATGVYTNEYLTSIDNNIPEGQSQGPGDFVSSAKIVEKVSPGFSNSVLSHFLGGQNAYSAFALGASDISGKLMQSTDDLIQREFITSLEEYLYDELTLDAMWQEFKTNVSYELPYLNIY